MGAVEHFNRREDRWERAHHFCGPRLNLDIYLKEYQDGTLQSGEGRKFTLRKYSGLPRSSVT
jgi:hypothetical protein